MVPAELVGAWAKLDRASEHMVGLGQALAEWADSVPNRLTLRYDQDSGYHVLHARVLKDPPSRLGAIVGDILLNLRTALDYLAWELAVKSCGGQEPPNPKSIQFPILDAPSEWSSNGSARQTLNVLRTVPGLEAEMADVQPYQAKWTNGLMAVLPLLRDLCNGDKHRRLRVVYWHPNGKFVQTSPWPPILAMDILGGPIEHGAILARFKLEHPPRDANVTFDLGLYVAIQEAPDWEIGYLLANCRLACIQLLDDFGRQFFA